ncbi:alpha/beta hydrolase fold domain-containing protein [Myroides pelagicus]|uniref:Alpha/beta hydrolase fold domain-containing protein n=2 Tax=Myroides pelagicus TaxID=270914 RepID=A0A7K1GJS4_9FLAO|nr:alpha/beta hydrolase fold domain-containing protein [Myroides pelagicus]
MIYFHGYGSDKTSRKFLDCKELFKNSSSFCVEWTPESDIEGILNVVEAGLAEQEQVILIGDSTGANLAYQLRDKRKEKGLKSVLVLLSPLLELDARLNTKLLFSDNLRENIVKITNPEDAFILIGKQDEVLDYTGLQDKITYNTEILFVEDSHRLPKFRDYLGYINYYVQRKLKFEYF